MPQIDSHSTAKLYVDDANYNCVDESTLLRLDPDGKLNLEDHDCIIPNSSLTSLKTIVEIPTKSYFDSLHQEKEQSPRDLGIDFYDESSELVKNNQDNDLNDNKLTNLDSITVIRDPSFDNELSTKKHIDNELNKNTILRIIHTLQNYLKVSVGNDDYNHNNYDKIQNTETTTIKHNNSGVLLLQNWVKKSNDTNNKGKIQNFIRSTTTSSSTDDSGVTGLPVIGNGFMCIETSSNNHGDDVFVSFTGTDVIQITNITFYYNGFSF